MCQRKALWHEAIMIPKKYNTRILFEKDTKKNMF